MNSWCLAVLAALTFAAGPSAKCHSDTAPAVATRSMPLSVALPSRTPAAMAADQGEGVLYDQLPNIAVYALPVADYSDPDAALYASQAVDDFDVTDPEGWTVTAFDFILYGDENLTAPADVTIYPAGLQNLPSATPICSAPAAVAAWDAEDPSSTARVNLPSPCVLPPGKYWVSPAGSERTFRWLAYDDPGARGLPALWRSPGGSYGDACRDWADVFKCWNTANADVKFNFRVLGYVGHDNDGIDLTVTLAPFDASAPETCGSASDLTVTVGDQVSVCYTMTNRSGTDLHFHTLSDNLAGDLFVQREQPVGLDQSMTFQRVITVGLTPALVATWTARNFAASYTVDDTVTADFLDLSTSPDATELPPTQYPMADDGAVVVPAPFPFPMFGRIVEKFCIGNNGYLIVGSPAEAAPFCSLGDLWANGALPNSQFNWPAILPAWMDLYLDGTTYYETFGEPGARRFVVEWYQRNRWATAPAPGQITFEVLLDEATGAITFLYDGMAFEDAASPSGDYGQQATVGLQETPTSALQYSFGQPLLTNGKTIRWTPTVPQTLTHSSSAHLDIGAPNLVATPTALQLTVETGAMTTTAMQLSNQGNRDLIWSVEGAWPTLHFPPNGDRDVRRLESAADVDRRSFGRPAPTAASMFKAEQKRRTRSQDLLPTGLPLTVPAYGIYAEYIPESESVERYLVALDAAAPYDYERIAISPSGSFGPPPFNYALNASGAAFVDNDFSRLYVIGLSGTFGYFDLTQDGAFDIIQVRIEADPSDDTVWCTYDPAQPCWYGLTWDATTSTLYAVGVVYDYDFAPVSSQLFSLDLTTGTPTPVGMPMQALEIRDIAIDPQGLMYGIDPTSDMLVAIDKTNGEYQPIGSIGFDAYGGGGGLDQSLSFDPSTGSLWYAATRYVSQDEMYGEMYTIDTLTGAATLRAPLYQDAPFNVFEIAIGNGPCSRPTDIAWLTYPDTTQGTTAPNGAASVTVGIDAQGLAPGVYEADVCVFSNDPARRNHPLSVPVRLTVTGSINEQIFVSGFEVPVS